MYAEDVLEDCAQMRSEKMVNINGCLATSFIAGNCLLEYFLLAERNLPEILARMVNPAEYLYLVVIIDEKRGKDVFLTL